MTTTATSIGTRATASEATRWGQLIFGIICMVMIANLQYGWTLFVNPIDQKYHWGRAAIQVAFTIFVLTETWLVPFEGYLIDKFGPRVMVCGSGALARSVEPDGIAAVTGVLRLNIQAFGFLYCSKPRRFRINASFKQPQCSRSQLSRHAAALPPEPLPEPVCFR